jgi:hypothetical protein
MDYIDVRLWHVAQTADESLLGKYSRRALCAHSA